MKKFSDNAIRQSQHINKTSMSTNKLNRGLKTDFLVSQGGKVIFSLEDYSSITGLQEDSPLGRIWSSLEDTDPKITLCRIKQVKQKLNNGCILYGSRLVPFRSYGKNMFGSDRYSREKLKH